MNLRGGLYGVAEISTGACCPVRFPARIAHATVRGIHPCLGSHGQAGLVAGGSARKITC